MREDNKSMNDSKIQTATCAMHSLSFFLSFSSSSLKIKRMNKMHLKRKDQLDQKNNARKAKGEKDKSNRAQCVLIERKEHGSFILVQFKPLSILLIEETEAHILKRKERLG